MAPFTAADMVATSITLTGLAFFIANTFLYSICSPAGLAYWPAASPKTQMAQRSSSLSQIFDRNRYISGNENQGSYLLALTGLILRSCGPARVLCIAAVRLLSYRFHAQDLTATELNRYRARTLACLDEVGK